MTNEMLKFTMRDKHNIQFTKEEAKVAIGWYKQMILILESIQNDSEPIFCHFRGTEECQDYRRKRKRRRSKQGNRQLNINHFGDLYMACIVLLNGLM